MSCFGGILFGICIHDHAVMLNDNYYDHKADIITNTVFDDRVLAGVGLEMCRFGESTIPSTLLFSKGRSLK